jgi:tRNA(fMet)-specific endonuclease VapC
MHMLDANICIYIIKKKPLSIFKKFEQLPIGSVVMSLVTYGELEYGALRSNNSEQALNVLEELANYIPVLPAGLNEAKHYAEIRADLASKGTPIGNNDLWIAAHARSLGHTLVSNNVKEFERVNDLTLENWV